MPMPKVPKNLELDPRAQAAAQKLIDANHALKDRSFWPVRMFTSLNLFLWHLEAFESDGNPVDMFVEAFEQAAKTLENVAVSGVCGNHFPSNVSVTTDEKSFENHVSGLFSDIWLGMTDDVYFDETYEFTRQRLEKSGVEPEELFGGKLVVDAGCGSGKFSAAIARFGAKKVIGLDIGEDGLAFARAQSAKADYGDRLDYRYGSLLDIPLEDSSVDLVWSNGVIHHTLNYEKCVEEFARVLKPGGTLFLYVNGRCGLFELLLDTLRLATADVPRSLFQHFLTLLGVNSGRIYWTMDCLYAPYEWKARDQVIALLKERGFGHIQQLTRGVASDLIEKISVGEPYAEAKYGEGQLKFLATLDTPLT